MPSAFLNADPPTGSGPFRIAIIGAGVTGRVLAQALLDRVKRAPGGRPVLIRIFDAKAFADEPVGDPRALELWPNALAALETVNGKLPAGPATTVMAEVIAHGYVLDRYDFRGMPGNLTTAIPTGAISKRIQSQTRVLSPLQLHKAVTAGFEFKEENNYNSDETTHVHVHTGAKHTLRALSMVGAGPSASVKLEFGSGTGSTKKAYADLVLAADGGCSAVRRLAKPQSGSSSTELFKPRPQRVSRLVCLVGETTNPVDHEFTLPGTAYVTHGQDIRFGAWLSPEPGSNKLRWLCFLPATTLVATDPVGSDEAYLKGFLSVLEHGYPKTTGDLTFKDVWANWRKGVADPASGADTATTERADARATWLKKRLLRCLEGFHAAARDAVKDTNLANGSTTFALHVLADADVAYGGWYAHRVALIGDAAHPILPDLGQGCGLAFEDVEALARRMAEHLWPDGTLVNWTTGPKDVVEKMLDAWRDERHGRAAEIVNLTRLASEAAHLDTSPPMVRDAMTMAFAGPMMVPNLLRLVSYRPPETIV